MCLQIRLEVFPVKAIFLPALLLCVLLLSFCLTGCRKEPLDPAGSAANTESETIETEAAQKGVYHKLTPEEAYDRMQKGGVTVVDVRTKAEYDGGHIANAVLVPNETIADTPPLGLPDKAATLLIYCRSGRRSRDAAEKLLALGYENIYDFGGINDWPYETVTQ